MIAVLQFDSVSLPMLDNLMQQGQLPAIAKLRQRGHWYKLDTPASSFEGATHYTVYSGRHVSDHGIYFPFMWSPASQRVQHRNNLQTPEPVWDRIGRAGRRSLVIDPYEAKPPQSLQGAGLGGWQFRHKITLHSWSLPRGLARLLEHRFGAPPSVEEVYGRPSLSDLARMREVLTTAPRRLADTVVELIRREEFDLVWVTLSSGHIAGHWFFDPSQLPQDQFDQKERAKLGTALADSYRAIDDGLSHILETLPAGADVILMAPNGMGSNISRAHLLPGMLHAVLEGGSQQDASNTSPGSAIWRLRAAIPTGFRTAIARALPEWAALELTARLELRGTDWAKTRAFMMPSGDCGYVRINLKGRERDGIVKPEEAEDLLDDIARGLQTFRDPDGCPTVRRVERGAHIVGYDTHAHHFPDLVVYWNDRVPPHFAGVTSTQYGEVTAIGWGSGRTGEHRDDAWALVVPGSSMLRAPTKPLHIVDMAATICSVLGVDAEGLAGQPLLERRQEPAYK